MHIYVVVNDNNIYHERIKLYYTNIMYVLSTYIFFNSEFILPMGVFFFFKFLTIFFLSILLFGKLLWHRLLTCLGRGG